MGRKKQLQTVDEAALRRVLAENGFSAAGVILFLAWGAGLSAADMTTLRWEDISFDSAVLYPTGRRVPLDDDTYLYLMRLYERRRSEFVVVSDARGVPMHRVNISAAARAALNSESALRDITLKDLRDDFICRLLRRYDAEMVCRVAGLSRETLRTSYPRAAARRKADTAEDALLVSRAQQAGGLDRAAAAELLGIAGDAAYRRLRRLCRQGALVRVGMRYYPAGSVVAPEEQYETVRRYLAETGVAYRKDIAAALGLDGKRCGWVLHKMVAAGQLVLDHQRYTLPEK